MRTNIFGGIFLLLSLSCIPLDQSSQVFNEGRSKKPKLDQEYWYSGLAEISRYDLNQFRYRDSHPGEVIQIFVTEDFLTDKQVKNDLYSNPNSISVLKNNQMRRFTTGLYDYSVMTSVFTPADGSPSEKVTFSSQDWCGQNFVQLNRSGDEYKAQIRSYFESEGDTEFYIQADLLEDEIFNLARIDPKLLPTGEIQALPSITHLRFSHAEFSSYPAKASLLENKEQNTVTYTILYPEWNRIFEAVFERKSPYRLKEWTVSLHGEANRENTKTRATKTSELREAYWTKNGVGDKSERIFLGVEGFRS
jgi:hypothetical protein